MMPTPPSDYGVENLSTATKSSTRKYDQQNLTLRLCWDDLSKLTGILYCRILQLMEHIF